MNAGVIELQHAPPLMPRGLLGAPTPIPRIDSRPSGFDPQSISGLALWFDATEASTIVAQGDGSVSEWRSRVGGFTSSDIESSRRPVRVSSAINGRPALLFDGLNDRLQTNYSASRLTGFVTYAAAVLPSSRVFTNSFPAVICARASGLASGLLVNPDTKRWAVIHRAGLYTSTAGSVATQTPTRVVATFSPTLLRIRVNGRIGREAVTSIAGSQQNGTFVIGHDTDTTTRHWHGMIGEILVWSRTLTEIELDQVDSYLASKWAIGS